MNAEALFEMADIFHATSGQMHMLHLNVRGPEFDTMHKKVLKKYYEQLDEDYDSAAEWGRALGGCAPNPNLSAERISFNNLPPVYVTRDNAVLVCTTFLKQMLDAMHLLWKVANAAAEECPICTGIANWLQTRIEYWAKEVAYFNTARGIYEP